MGEFLKLLQALPKMVQIVIISVILGVGFAYAHEARYMTISDFNKGYILDLKKNIRDIQATLRTATLSPVERRIYAEELAQMIAELCYEVPNDNYCPIRT
jgi:hypothetical protein